MRLATIYQSILNLAYIAATDITDGAYEAHIRNLSFTFTDGSAISAADIPANLTVQRLIDIETLSVTPLRVVGYYNVIKMKLPQEPDSDVYIIVYENGETRKVFKSK
jgi:hypothetical protein